VGVLLLLAGLPLSASDIAEHYHTEDKIATPAPIKSGSGQAFGYESVPLSEEGARRVAEARKLTASGKKAEALAIYESLVESERDAALPILLRFLRLTGEDALLEARLGAIRTDKSVSPLTLGRSLAAAGKDEEVVRVLEGAAGVTEFSDPAMILLLGRTYAALGSQEKKQELLGRAIVETKDDQVAAILFQELTARKELVLGDQVELLAKAVDRGMASMGIKRREALRRLDGVLIGLQFAPNYFERREKVLALGKELGPGAAWLASRLLVREEKFDAALEYLTPLEQKHRGSALWPVLAEERGEILRSLGRLDEYKAVVDSVAKQTEGDAIQQELARAALAVKQYDEALVALNKIDLEKVDPDTRRETALLLLNTLAEKGDIKALIDGYGRVTTKANADDFDLYDRVIFQTFRETHQQHQIEEEIRARFQEQPKTTPVNLWRLAAAAADQAYRPPNVLEALYNWVQARPGELMPIRKLAEKAFPIAKTLAETPKDQHVIPPQQVENLQYLAEQSLIELVRAHPLEPEAYQALIELYAARGEKDIPEKILNVAARNSTDSRVIGVAGYALALKGYPEMALVVYDRALEFDPLNYDVKMNRAACLTRLDRWDEALEVYKDVLVNGYKGRNYHVHEMISRVFGIYDHLKKRDEAVAYFRAAADKIPESWRDEFIRDTGNQLVNSGLLAEGEEFYRRVIKEGRTPAMRMQGWENLGGANFAAKNYAKCVELYREMLPLFPDDKAFQIRITQALAESLHRVEKSDEAIALFKELAAAHPHDQTALLSLVRGAEMAEERGKHDEAMVLYKAFLESDSTDFLRRASAEQKIQTLKLKG
jgi:tetratricopeptide (TPR) repeat protein